MTQENPSNIENQKSSKKIVVNLRKKNNIKVNDAETNLDESKQKLKVYLENLHKSRESWVRCWTYEKFGAGMLSTQRNESINHALKQRIQHFKRTNVVRIISIVAEMIDSQYQKVVIYDFKFLMLNNKTLLKIKEFSKSAKKLS